MYGEVECSDLVALFKIFLINRQHLASMESVASWFFTIPYTITSFDMSYSCAILDDLDGDLVSGAADSNLLSKNDSGADCCLAPSQDSLYEAQLRKLKHIIDKAKISSEQRVLAIAQTYPGTTIVTLTLSVQQQALAMELVQDAGLQDRVTVHLMDYRAMVLSWKASFGRVISYWCVLDLALKPEGGVGDLESSHKSLTFRGLVLFPRGFLPTLTLLLKSMEKGSGGCLIVDSVSNVGPHYARALREWRSRFVSRFESVIVPALNVEHPTIINGARGREEREVFRRKWLLGFTARVLGGELTGFVVDAG
ncbi:uncharacterized protein BJ212DRAFT_1445057 [Suillus subaureus]|uniref:Uncharacterized protein n=1 Tax=Suillus subaureus TaxID=48587 RepID=A0A9P7EJA9_9AGAM|nr:uncharacterized protein BJ212DRAFT_1445057 [Suillus subaureus]KAG1822873.1 hypothetical protein BJ212DRAFT_1445057 [Suillus subaureus]